MLTRRAILAAALITAPGAMAAALLSPDTCPKNGGPVPSGPISWWQPGGQSWAAAVPADAGTTQYTTFPDGCGLGGQIGLKFYQNAAGPPMTTFAVRGSNTIGYLDRPVGVCPDQIMTPLFGTYEQSIFTSPDDICSVRFWEGLGGPGGRSFFIEFDFSQMDCTNLGAPTPGATFPGTLIGFSDYISGGTSSFYPTITFTPTVLGGGQAQAMGEWKIYNSNQVNVTAIAPGTQPYNLQEWVPGTSTGTLKGTDEQAPPGTLGEGYDTNFALVSLASSERYTKIVILFETLDGSGDFSVFTVGNAAAQCPQGTFLNEETGECDSCPMGTFYDSNIPACVPCPRRMTTFNCGATSVRDCHKPCPAGAYYDPVKQWCYRCPAGTWWPHTHVETTECLPCPGSMKVGADSCKSHTGYNHISAPRKNKTAKVEPKPVGGKPKVVV